MLIRSQDKSCIVKMDGVVIQTMRKEVVCYATSAIESNSYIPLGYYNAEEKTLKVLGMIGEAYAEYEMLKNAFGGIGSTFLHKSEKQAFEDLRERIKSLSVFQMPADNEVEV